MYEAADLKYQSKPDVCHRSASSVFVRPAVCHCCVSSVFIALLVAILAMPGCSQLIDPNVPEQILPFVEPEHGRDYLLYRPSSYDRQREWPLIVVCHGGFPDSPNAQMRVWDTLAEDKGFLVLAPTIEATGGLFPASVDKEVPRLRKDQAHIMSALQHVLAGHTVSPDRIFIHGAGGGAHAALRTGLTHPETFRAVSLFKPKFDSKYLTDIARFVDPWQPVFVRYDITDSISGRHGSRSVEWLRTKSTHVSEDKTGFARQRIGLRATHFYEDVLRTIPRIIIQAAPGDDPLEARFSLDASTPPRTYQWDFGDGQSSPVARPIHRYADAGTYRLSVTITAPDGESHSRTVRIKIPGPTVSSASSD